MAGHLQGPIRKEEAVDRTQEDFDMGLALRAGDTVEIHHRSCQGCSCIPVTLVPGARA